MNEEYAQSVKVSATSGKVSDLGHIQALVKSMSDSEFAVLCAAVDAARPSKALADMNLEHELLEQFETVKTLQNEVLIDESVPANQKAQVANTVASTLQQLVKAQADYYTSERFKAIEALMVKAMKLLPVEVAEKFIADYEALE